MVSWVLCFDRDLTVDVNPPEDGVAVPLAWVQAWAHDVDRVDVWATGNERLADEARVPSISTAMDVCEECLPGGADAGVERDALPGVHPSREYGLCLVRACYQTVEDDPAFVVVDDVDLSDLSRHGWGEYYPPEAFVEAVRGGQVGVGGVPRTADDWGTAQSSVDSPVAFHRPGPLRETGVPVHRGP